MLASSPGEAKELRRRVTSPGGTTQAAMVIMEDGRFRELVFKAAKAARDRSKELAMK
jgi:pyrroline-5-carboxylate reductase